jgi:hypothetical protein
MLRTALHTKNDDSLSADWKILFAVWTLKGSLWIFKFLKLNIFDFILQLKFVNYLICENRWKFAAKNDVVREKVSSAFLY